MSSKEAPDAASAAIRAGSTNTPIGLAWKSGLVRIHSREASQSPNTSTCSSTWFPSGSL